MMHEILLLLGATGMVAGLILLRIRFSPALHPDAELFINLLSMYCSENGTHESIENECLIFPGIARRFHWPFPDPQKVTGTHDEKLEKIRSIRDAIKQQIYLFLKNIKS